MQSAHIYLFLSRRKVSIAIATSALLFLSFTPNATADPRNTVNNALLSKIIVNNAIENPVTTSDSGGIPLPVGNVINSNINPNFAPGVHFFCTDATTKDLSYGGSGSKADCKSNSTSFGVTVNSTAFTQSTSIDDVYFCIDFNTLDIVPSEDIKSVTCLNNVNVIKVAKIDPAKFPNNHNFICADNATGNLTDGGSGSIPVPKTVASNCYSISATTSETTLPTINVSKVTEITPGVHFFCADKKTKDLSYGGSASKAKCKANSSSFGVVVTSLTRTKGGQESDEIFCINLKTADIRYDPFAFPCSPNFSMIFVATKKTDPKKYNQGQHFICLIYKTQYLSYETLSYGGSGSKAKPIKVPSDCFSVAAAIKATTSLVTVEILSSYLMCVDAGTNIVRHPIGNIGGCGQNSTSFYVGAQGQAGVAGVAGKDGKTIWNGTGDPENTWGQPGDMYINSKTFTLYGPKNLDGTWPAGVSMIGPKGEQGLTGPPGVGETGARGPAGATGSTGATGAASTVAGPAGANGANGTNGSDATLTCAQGGTCSLGSTGPGGGKVFYISTTPNTAATPWRYLEVAPSTWNGDTDLKMQWWACDAPGWVKELTAGTTSTTSNTKTTIGKGFSNTKMILGMCGYGAAQMSASYNGGGKSDWFLPSKDELNQLCKWARGIAWSSDATLCTSDGSLNSSTYGAASAGLQSLAGYWSSTEHDSSNAIFQAFSNGSQDSNGKHFDNVYVRPIRAF